MDSHHILQMQAAEIVMRVVEGGDLEGNMIYKHVLDAIASVPPFPRPRSLVSLRYILYISIPATTTALSPSSLPLPRSRPDSPNRIVPITVSSAVIAPMALAAACHRCHAMCPQSAVGGRMAGYRQILQAQPS